MLTALLCYVLCVVASVRGCIIPIGRLSVESLSNHLTNGVSKYDNDQNNISSGSGTSASQNDPGDNEQEAANAESGAGIIETTMALNMLLSADNISKMSTVTTMSSILDVATVAGGGVVDVDDDVDVDADADASLDLGLDESALASPGMSVAGSATGEDPGGSSGNPWEYLGDACKPGGVDSRVMLRLV